MNQHGRDIDRIEAEIAQTRAEIDTTLNELQGRFTPGQLLDQGLDYLKHSGGNEFISNFGATVKYNPMPVALAGIGIAWLMASGHRAPPPAGMALDDPLADRSSHLPGRGALRRAGETAGSVKASILDTAHASRQRVSSGLSSAREQAARIGERASRIGQSVRSGADSAKHGFQSMLEEQPLLVGAIGLALGAALAAALPRTRTEDELMGDASDRLAEEARRTGEAQIEKVGRAAHDAMEAGAAAAENTAGEAAGQSSPRSSSADQLPSAHTTAGGFEADSGWHPTPSPSAPGGDGRAERF